MKIEDLKTYKNSYPEFQPDAVERLAEHSVIRAINEAATDTQIQYPCPQCGAELIVSQSFVFCLNCDFNPQGISARLQKVLKDVLAAEGSNS